MPFDYYNDKYGKICISLANQCKTDLGFGSVLVKNADIIGIGRNRLSSVYDRSLLSHVDYASHAEQSAIIDALSKGHNVNGCNLYVIGIALRGNQKGKLTIKTEPMFVCNKCIHAIKSYNLLVNIPMVNGWYTMSPEEAFNSGKITANKGHWKNFIYGCISES